MRTVCDYKKLSKNFIIEGAYVQIRKNSKEGETHLVKFSLLDYTAEYLLLFDAF